MSEHDIYIVLKVVEADIAIGIVHSVKLEHQGKPFVISANRKVSGVLGDARITDRCRIFIRLNNAISIKIDQVIITRKFRSEEHTSELKSLMRISYAVLCLKKKQKYYNNDNT